MATLNRSDQRSFTFLSRTGCFLPFLIFFNLFFGWMFLRPAHWLLLEGLLILFFLINSYIITRKVVSTASRYDNTIDTEGEVVDERKNGQVKD
ncbi:hypothetical protein ACFL1K_05495 [Candidatus Omnitrophota bacterium]